MAGNPGNPPPVSTPSHTALAGDSIGFWRSVAQPVSAQAPIAGAALIPATMAGVTGGYGTLSFVLGIVAGAFVVYVVARLARQFASAGAFYYYAGLMVGIRLAVLIGWVYIMTYLLFAGAVVSQTADYFGSALGLAGAQPLNWLIFATIAWALAMFLISRRVGIPTLIQLILEGTAAVVMVVAGIIVLAKGGYHGTSFGFQYFGLHGTSPSGLFLGIAIAFSGFGGFESPAALSEEAKRPRFTVPMAMWASLFFSGALYVFASWIENVGFKSPQALAASATPLFTVVDLYVAHWVAVLLAFLATFSAFGAILGCSNGGIRPLYAMFRDGFVDERLARTHSRERSPIGAIAVWAIPMLALSVCFFNTDPATAFDYVVTAGGLLLTLSYLLLVATATWFFAQRRLVGPTLMAVVGMVILGYALYSSLYPPPAAPYRYLPYADLFLIAIGGAIVLFAKKALARMAQSGHWSRGIAADSDVRGVRLGVATVEPLPGDVAGAAGAAGLGPQQP
jgi:amino acid transporter